jgi:predicted MPP superfamily phosphohydrolase
VRQHKLEIAGWPLWSRPLRIVFLSDFHTGSHVHDVVRLSSIVDEATLVKPDIALFGGDYVNMQLFGGGARTTADGCRHACAHPSPARPIRSAWKSRLRL